MSVKLSSRLPLGYIEIRAFSHATEDQQRVQTAVLNILPEELRTDLVFQKTCLTGHHGNPILLLSTKIIDRKALQLSLRKIGEGLPTIDKQNLREKMGLHMEKSNLYLRFDKQKAFMSALGLSSNDPIHFKFHFKNQTSDQIVMTCEESGLLL